jgi:hypothetical protein
VNDVVLAMSAAPDVTGRIVMAEDGAPTNLQGVRVTLRPLSFDMSVPEVRSDTAGRLVFPKPIRPDRYVLDVNVHSLPDGCFLQKVTFGGQEVSADDFEIQTSARLDVVMSTTAGKITGLVLDSDGKPVPDSTVTLIPTDGKSRPRKEAVDDDGTFQFTALRPGTYKLLAWERLDDLWQDPDVRKTYEGKATEVTVVPSETQKVQVTLIAADEIK